MKFSMDKNLTFQQAVALMFEKLGESKIMALASSVNDYVMVRNVSCLFYDDKVWFKTDKNFRKTTRYPGDDKIMTKTMINNYAKNDLLPPPIRKKYSREHILVLIFIYYYKGILSISDIQTLLGPITEKFFHNDEVFDIKAIYEEIFQVGYDQIEALKHHVMAEYDSAMGTFEDAPEDSREFLKLFSFICFLSFDVYMKSS